MSPKPGQRELSSDERQVQKEQLILNLSKMEQALEGPAQDNKEMRDLLGSTRIIRKIVEEDAEKNLDQVGHLIETIRRRIESLGIRIVD